MTQIFAYCLVTIVAVVQQQQEQANNLYFSSETGRSLTIVVVVVVVLIVKEVLADFVSSSSDAATQLYRALRQYTLPHRHTHIYIQRHAANSCYCAGKLLTYTYK